MVLRRHVCFGLMVPVMGVCLEASTAAAFSLGIRPYVGSEIITIPSTTLVDPADSSRTLSGETKSVQRSLIFYGSELSAALFEKGSFSISALLGFRMTNSATTSGAVNDTLGMSYVPVGASVDFAIKKLRASGYFAYDLGIGPKFVLTVAQPSNTLDLKMTGLSRMRFGALGEFFFMKSLSAFGMADYSMGSYSISGGPLTIFNKETNEEVAVSVVGGKNKISALTFGGGIAYYIPAPMSQRGEAESKPATPKKPAGKQPAKKVKPAKPAPAVSP
jgi:hypothetical protein